MVKRLGIVKNSLLDEFEQLGFIDSPNGSLTESVLGGSEIRAQVDKCNRPPDSNSEAYFLDDTDLPKR